MRPYAVVVLVFLLVGILVLPVSARYSITGQNTFYTGSPVLHINQSVTDLTFDSSLNRTVISNIEFRYPVNTQINFTLTYGNARTVSGSVLYSSIIPLISSYSGLGLGSEYYGDQFLDAFQSTGRTTLSGYARNDTAVPATYGFILYDSAYIYGINEQAVFHQMNDTSNNLIYRITFHSNRPIDCYITTNDPFTVGKAVYTNDQDVINSFKEFIFVTVAGLLSFVFSLMWILKIVMVDNIVLTASLFLMGGLAYAANTSNNIYQFWTKFIGIIRKFFEFAVFVFNSIVNIVTSIISALKPFG